LERVLTMVSTRSLFCRWRAAALAASSVAALASTLNAGAKAAASLLGSWDYVLRHDVEGQPQAAFARLRGEKGSLLWLTCQRQSLDGDQPPVRFSTVAIAQRQYLGRSDSRGRSTVYWFDEGTPEVGHWLYRDRYGQIPEAEEVRTFVEKLSGARSLTVELSNYRFETQKLEFQLDAADTKNVADRFRKDCGAILRESAESSQISTFGSLAIEPWEAAP